MENYKRKSSGDINKTNVYNFVKLKINKLLDRLKNYLII